MAVFSVYITFKARGANVDASQALRMCYVRT